MKTFEVEFTDGRVRHVDAEGVWWRKNVVEFYTKPNGWKKADRSRDVMFNRDAVFSVRLLDTTGER